MKPALRLLLTGSAFSPAVLFRAGEQGVWFDPSDFATMWQDSAGTTPVTATGQPVGKILDKSGRGNHATQGTAASRPTLQQDASGYYYLNFDGTDDGMATGSINFTGTDKMTVIAGVHKASDAVFGTVVSLGGVYLGSKTSGQYEIQRNGGVSSYTSSAAFPAPHTGVVACGIDYAAAQEITAFRVSGANQTISAGDTGSGNMGEPRLAHWLTTPRGICPQGTALSMPGMWTLARPPTLALPCSLRWTG